MRESRHELSKISGTHEVVIPVCTFKVNNVTISIIISLKDEEHPLLSYVSTDHVSLQTLSTIDDLDFVTLYARAYKNTVSSPKYIIHGYRVAVSVSTIFVLTMLTSLLSEIEHVRGIILMKDIIYNKGFDCADTQNLLENLSQSEAARRFLYKKAKVIQVVFREAISNPNKLMCTRRLLREFGELCSSI